MLVHMFSDQYDGSRIYTDWLHVMTDSVSCLSVFLSFSGGSHFNFELQGQGQGQSSSRATNLNTRHYYSTVFRESSEITRPSTVYRLNV